MRPESGEKHLFERLLAAMVLPIVASVVIPLLLVAGLNPIRIQYVNILPIMQIPLGILFFGLGIFLVSVTIRLFATIGKGTLAPWDPPKRLVIQSVYKYTRNPMISGVCFMLLGETILVCSWILLVWVIAFACINTIYFKLLEEPGLVKRFGKEYSEYRRNVPMWIPRLKPWEPGKVI